MYMTNLRKAVLNAILGIASLGVVSIFWEQPYLLTATLICITVLMFFIRTEKQSFVVYIVGFIFGPIAEIVAIHAGAWQYAAPSFSGIPIWLPFLWANAALFIVNTEKLAHTLFRNSDN